MVLAAGPGRFSLDELIVRKLAPKALAEAEKLDALLQRPVGAEFQN